MNQSMDYTLPTKQVIHVNQAGLLEQPEVQTPLGRARRRSDGPYRVAIDSDSMCLIPEGARRLQSRVMVYAHTGEAGHRDVTARLVKLGPNHIWPGMATTVQEFVHQ